ncbi:MAG TPA: ATP-binding cassette domain-containing protein [Saprospiraceae bacterium]|nr:ATP-binding cassette domain-containing protein [Saprospiraceae bacterium]HMQ85188.1 ATP-binding cassette domain-containing protein [Saprospiraceae bacterium]
MIDISDISFNYGDKPVLKGVSIAFESGKIHGIVGLNGSGKTTFFKLLAKMLRPQSGQILWNAQPITRLNTAFLETENYFYPKLTGREYLAIFKQSNPRFQLDAFQAIFALPLDKLIEYYSAGMKKKLALLAILKQDKPIYIFDEPFNGLDMESAKILELTLRAMTNPNRVILIASHILAPLLHVCDEIHLLQAGLFQRSYAAESFHQIESALFSELEARWKDLDQLL